MRKTIVFLTLVMLAGCAKQEPPPETKKGLSGADNDSPIIISDTTTIMDARKKPETTATHGKGFGKGSKNKYTVHDKSAGDKDDYQPACLVFSSSTVPVQIPDGTTSWQITYPFGGSSEILVSWSEPGDLNGDARDITLDKNFTKKGNDLAMPFELTEMSFSEDPTPVKANGVTIHYCPVGPNGQKCILNGVDPCHP